ncbi:hypothetical protein [Kitasatospora sp. NPDC048407]|uniref:hypothetical protein n=1 Tax=Kitasatospora sp. NPDC048407 TaxID=3364051 RepID=UPI003710DBF2
MVETVMLDGCTDVRRGTFVGVFRGEIRIRPVGGGLEWGAKAEDVALDLAERVRLRNRNSRIGGAGRASV